MDIFAGRIGGGRHPPWDGRSCARETGVGLMTQTSDREIGGIFVTKIPLCFPEGRDEGKVNDCQNGSSPTSLRCFSEKHKNDPMLIGWEQRSH